MGEQISAKTARENGKEDYKLFSLLVPLKNGGTVV
jgi:hypothetical protein